MVAGFRRSFSLTISTSSSSSSPVHPSSSPKGRGSTKSYHVRSTSLPCRSHPIISQVEDETRGLRAWQSLPHPNEPSTSSVSSGLCHGLAQLELLLASLHHLIQLPQSVDSLSHPASAAWVDTLLDDILRLADAHGSFRSAAMDLKQHHTDVQIAIRRNDDAALASSLRSQRKSEKVLVKLASSLRNVTFRSSLLTHSNAEEAELAGILGEAVVVAMSASQTLFSAVAAASSVVAKSSPSPPSSPRLAMSSLRRLSSPLRKKNDSEGEASRAQSLKYSRAMEECLATTEKRSERVIKSLIRTRVALLNTLTSSF